MDDYIVWLNSIINTIFAEPNLTYDMVKKKVDHTSALTMFKYIIEQYQLADARYIGRPIEVLKHVNDLLNKLVKEKDSVKLYYHELMNPNETIPIVLDMLWQKLFEYQMDHKSKSIIDEKQDKIGKIEIVKANIEGFKQASTDAAIKLEILKAKTERAQFDMLELQEKHTSLDKHITALAQDIEKLQIDNASYLASINEYEGRNSELGKKIETYQYLSSLDKLKSQLKLANEEISQFGELSNLPEMLNEDDSNHLKDFLSQIEKLTTDYKSLKELAHYAESYVTEEERKFQEVNIIQKKAAAKGRDMEFLKMSIGELHAECQEITNVCNYALEIKKDLCKKEDYCGDALKKCDEVTKCQLQMFEMTLNSHIENLAYEGGRITEDLL